jgi:hypothetical protein
MCIAALPLVAFYSALHGALPNRQQRRAAARASLKPPIKNLKFAAGIKRNASHDKYGLARLMAGSSGETPEAHSISGGVETPAESSSNNTQK